MDQTEGPPFLLHPSSPAFLAGDTAATRERLETPRDALDVLMLTGMFVAGFFLVVTLALAGQDLAADRDPSHRLPDLALGLMLFAAALFIQATRAREARTRLRIATEGRTVPGVVLGCRGESLTDPDGNPAGYRVEIDYRFTSPTGHAITDRDEALRDDLAGEALPEEGAAVLVLWLDDGHYALL